MIGLKEKIYSGETVHGCWINLGSHVSAEIVSEVGFDWLLIDMEHGAGNDAMLYHQLQVMKNSHSAAIVRIDELSRPKVQRILDSGADGIMYPQLQNQQEALFAINCMYYPPKGIRGMAKMVRATGFGEHTEKYISNLEKHLVGVIQIETLNALKEAEAIAQLDGVDVLFVGPADLSLALGIPGQLRHKDYQKAIRTVASAAKASGKAAGILLLDIEEYEMYFELGYRFIASGADSTFVRTGAKNTLHSLKEKSEHLKK